MTARPTNERLVGGEPRKVKSPGGDSDHAGEKHILAAAIPWPCCPFSFHTQAVQPRHKGLMVWRGERPPGFYPPTCRIRCGNSPAVEFFTHNP